MAGHHVLSAADGVSGLRLARTAALMWCCLTRCCRGWMGFRSAGGSAAQARPQSS